MGRAIVTTDVPGCREVVRHGHNGLLVPSRDVERLAAALLQLLLDGERRRQMGEHGRQLAAAEFDVQLVVRRTLALYEDSAA